MLSFSFASPYLVDQTLDPARDPVQVTARVQQARKSMHARRRSATTTDTRTHQPHTTGGDDGKPSMLARRASLAYHLTQPGHGEIPSEPLQEHHPQHAKKLANGATLQPKVLGEVELPYDIKGAQESDDIRLSTTMPGDEADPSSAVPFEGAPPPPLESNGLPRIDFSTCQQLFAQQKMKPLMKQLKSGFASDQRRDIWPRLLVLPSTVVHVDLSAYYRTVETVWHLATNSLTGLFDEEDLDSEAIVKQAAELQRRLPTDFPAAPLLGRSTPFDWTALAMTRRPEQILAQQRILCAISATNELTYAPQLPAVVAIVYHALGNDEPRAHAFVSSMLQRSRMDDSFVLLSPISVELFLLGFQRAFAQHLPDLARHFAKCSFDVGGWVRSHLADCFLGGIPHEAVLRVWDLAVLVGFPSAAIKFTLTLLGRFEPYLLSGSGVLNQAGEVADKLAKLARVMNVASLFGSTTTHAGGWQTERGLYSKVDLAKLTAPSGAGMIVLADELLDLPPTVYHVPRLFDDTSSNGNGNCNNEAEEDRSQAIIGMATWRQLYSGILPPRATRCDPHRIYSTATDAHSLQALLQCVSEQANADRDSTSGSVGGGGVFILVQTLARKVFGVYFECFPIADVHAAATSASSSDRADEAQPKEVRWEKTGWLIDLTGATPMARKFVGAPLTLGGAGGPIETVPGASQAGTSLPILPIEGGPSARRGSAAGTNSNVNSTKRRGSLAALLDALKIKKSDHDLSSVNSSAVNRLLSQVPPLSPFRHAVRITDGSAAHSAAAADEIQKPSLLRAHSSVEGDATIKMTTMTKGSPGRSSAPTTPRGRMSATNSGASSSASQSIASTPGPSTRRQSLVAAAVAGLEKAWQFATTVPNSTAASTQVSPARSRRQSITGEAGTTRSPLNSTNAASIGGTRSVTGAGTGGRWFFPSNSAPGSGLNTPTRSSRTLGVGSSLPPRAASILTPDGREVAQQSSPHASSASNANSSRSRALTTTERVAPLLLPSPSDSGDIERHLALMKQRESAWDQQANEQEALKLGAAAGTAATAEAAPTSSKEPDVEGQIPPALAVADGATSGDAASLYLSSISSPVGSSELDGAISSAVASRRSSLATVMTPSAALQQCRQENSESSTSPDPLRGDSSPSSPSDREPTGNVNFLTMSAMFRARRLTIDDDLQPEAPHVETVKNALTRRNIDLLPAAAVTSRSSHAAVGTATILVSPEVFILTDPSAHLVFSLNSTLLESVIQCDGMNSSSSTTDPSGAAESANSDAARTVELNTVEVWTFA